MHKFLPLLILPLAACNTMDAAEPPPTTTVASANLVRADGSPAGTATISRRDGGLWMSLSADAPAAGTYGMHLHMVGKCEGPKFTSAGAHWNPAMKMHGTENPMGPHAGDLPNVIAGADRKISFEQMLGDIQLTGAGGLLDTDGATVMIHAMPDDYRTDPSGNSGDRIICGVLLSINTMSQ